MRYNERKIKSNAELSTDILGHPHYNKIYNRSKTIKAYIYILYIFPEKNITGIIQNTPGLNATKQDNTTNWLKFQRSSLFLHNQSLLIICPCSYFLFSLSLFFLLFSLFCIHPSL